MPATTQRNKAIGLAIGLAASLAAGWLLWRRSSKQNAASIYRSPEGEAELMALYDDDLVRLSVEYESRRVNTRFGITHVLAIGPQAAPPLVILQGGNTTNPSGLGWFRPLLNRYRVYAPDTVGHPGRSAQTRLSPRDLSYGQWAADVLDGLGLERTAVLGVSFGGGVLLRLAACVPQRISKAVLIVPTGFVHPPLRSMILDLGLPYLLYRLSPSRERLAGVVQTLTGGEVDEDLMRITRASFQHVNIEPQMPRPATQAEMIGFKAPTLVIAAEKDIICPGDAILARAREIIPNLAAVERLEGCPHYIPARHLGWINDRVVSFLG